MDNSLTKSITMNSVEIVWITIFASAYFILYLSPINFFYSNLVILQLLLLFFVYNFNISSQTKDSTFNSGSVLGLIVIQIISLINNVNVTDNQTTLSFVAKTGLLLSTIFFSTKSGEMSRTISTFTFIILAIWFIFDKNSMSFNYQN